jgi:hypothetical protein
LSTVGPGNLLYSNYELNGGIYIAYYTISKD